MSNRFGTRFSVTTFGESHGRAVGAVVDGCPAGLALSEPAIQAQLDRRRPGRSKLASSRAESDRVAIFSGVEDGRTLGGPIALLVENKDHRPTDYARVRAVPRPSHADYTYQMKYGIRASSGGGRASARETVGRVAGGAVAEQFLSERYDVSIVAWVSAVATVTAPDLSGRVVRRAEVDASEVRCPDSEPATAMTAAITAAREAGDSVGGVITCVCRGVPVGWGEPVFGKLEATLAAGMLSIPAAKGFEVGSGFAGTRMRGSEHNDVFVAGEGRLGTATNRSGGIQGGITNGAPIVLRVAFKPTATIAKPQQTVDFEGRPVTLEGKGRHDPCVLPRAVPVVEGMAAIALADAALLAAGGKVR